MSTSRYWFWMVLLLVVAAALRVYLAVSIPYLFDEKYDWLIEASRISLSSEDWRLPIRTERHGALGAYFMRVGSEILGDSHLGWRSASILGGLGLILGVAAVAKYLFGEVAGLLSTFIAVFAEYPIMISSVAVQIVFFMMFTAWSLYFFTRYLVERRDTHLLASAALTGLAFLTYEVAGLAAITMFVWLLFGSRGHVIRDRAAWAAAGIFVMLVLPDAIANALGASSELDYRAFLDKVAAVGWNPEPLQMYFPNLSVMLFPLQTGEAFPLNGHEYRPFGDLYGIVLILSLCLVPFYAMRAGRDRKSAALFLAFQTVFVFGVFSGLQVAANTYGAVWFWASGSAVSGMVLMGGVAAIPDRTRLLAGALVGGATIVSLGNLTLGTMNYSNYQVGVAPLYLEGAPGEMKTVRVFIETCDICDKAPSVKLIEVGRRDLANFEYSAAVDPADLDLDIAPGNDYRFGLRIAADIVVSPNYIRNYLLLFDLSGTEGPLGTYGALAVIRAPGTTLPPRDRPFFLIGKEWEDPAIY